ncbi:MAG: prepilin-type N-terminal cleavage/methylation domain-containing protein [Bacilli bacterium]|nr:prepilin-type N-terminal cleavage/methylation domain-containing protein [Bacilli bacterium]MDD3305147.1 prepilin-type N-terminal cleavage/methylation domain-containing protein [Bacilli bacterium]MDD4053669.1 prepilin-type N-terminal cleavage/methylation domain-containing protein [Bacilli bacterium]MDD4411168.1 prepilin-type N-terminal cleavage/methylation domain-containing protein [Bacilli bacterium]
MLKNKKGFTLVELLAVIVILAIILAIAVPGITGIINSAKKGSFESDVKMIITGIEYQVLGSSVDPTVTVPVVGDILSNLDDYGADPANYTAASITSMDPITVSITSSSTSEFGAWTTVGATKASVTVTVP